MFIVKRITLENFMNVEHAEIEFDNRQITAFVGDNGMGKSTLVYAIALAFSGYKKGEKYQSYVRSGSPYARVTMDAILFGYPASYDITIVSDNAKKEKVTNKKVLNYKGQTYVNNDYTAFIKEHNLDSLESIVFMFQGASDITDAKPSEISDMLKSIFGFDSISDAADSIKSKQTDVKNESIENKAIVNELKGRVYNVQQLIRTLPEERIQNLENELNLLNESLDKVKSIDSNSYSLKQREFISCNNEIDSLSNKINSLSSFIDSKVKTIEENKKIAESIDVNECKSLLEKTQSDIRSHEEKRQSQLELMNELKSSLSVLNHDHSQIERQIEISKTGVCHACGQPIDEDHVSKLEKSLESINESIKEITSNISAIGYDPLDSVGKELKTIVDKCNKDIDRYNDTLRQISNDEHILESNKTLLEEYMSNKSSKEEEKTRISLELAELESIKPQIEQKNELKIKIDNLKNDIETYKSNIVKNEERKRYNRELEIEKQENDKKIVEYDNKINDIEKRLAILKESYEVLEKGFSNYMVIKTCETLSNSINNIVRKVFPYMSVRLQGDKKGVNFFYKTDDSRDDWMSVSMASGAQRQVLSLGYKLAIAKNYHSSSIFLDEIDSSCSIEAAKIIYEFILSLDDFDQIFLITHKPDIIDVAKDKDVVLYGVDHGEYSLI